MDSRRRGEIIRRDRKSKRRRKYRGEKSIEEEQNKMKERVDRIFGKMERSKSENNMRKWWDEEYKKRKKRCKNKTEGMEKRKGKGRELQRWKERK